MKMSVSTLWRTRAHCWLTSSAFCAPSFFGKRQQYIKHCLPNRSIRNHGKKNRSVSGGFRVRLLCYRPVFHHHSESTANRVVGFETAPTFEKGTKCLPFPGVGFRVEGGFPAAVTRCWLIARFGLSADGPPFTYIFPLSCRGSFS